MKLLTISRSQSSKHVIPFFSPLAIVICTLAFFTIFIYGLCENSYADIYGGTGGADGSAGACGGDYNPSSDFNCCSNVPTCPHYMVANISGFKSVVQYTISHGGKIGNEASAIINQPEYEICTNPNKNQNDRVAFVGIINNNSLSQVRINNHHVDPYIDFKERTSWWDYSALNKLWTVHDENGNAVKEPIWETKNKLIAANPGKYSGQNSAAYKLAFWCADMDKGGSTADTEYISRTVLKATGGDENGVADTGFQRGGVAQEVITAEAGDTVSFKITQQLKVSSSSENVQKYAKTNWTTSYTVKSGGGAVNLNERGTNGQRSFSDKKAVKIDDNKGIATLSIPESASPDSTYIVCGKITYNTSSKKGSISKEQSSTESCITVSVSKQPPNDKICDRLASNPKFGITTYSDGWGITARTQGFSAVIKNSKDDDDWTNLALNGQVPVFAKPTDDVRFLHCYYPYAHVPLRVTNHGGHTQDCLEWDEDEDGDEVPPCLEWGPWYPSPEPSGEKEVAKDYRDDFEDADSYCAIKGKSDQKEYNSSGEGYLFDYTNSDLCDGTGLTKEKEARWRTKPIAMKSPNNASNYTCNGLGRVGYYNIVGLDPRDNCNSDSGGETSFGTKFDPGHYFEQWMNYWGLLKTGSVKVSHSEDGDNCSRSEEGRMNDSGSEWIRNCNLELTHDNYYVTNDDAKETGNKDTDHAKVVVPFNFNTTIETEATSATNGGIVYPGTVFSTDVHGEIKPAMNEDVANSEGGKVNDSTYTTLTPSNTKVQIAHFTIAPNAGQDSKLSGDNNYSGSKLEEYVRDISGVDGDSIDVKSLLKNKKEEDSLNKYSENDYDYSDDLVTDYDKTVVPDAPAGTKVCVIAAIYPSDSHGTPGSDIKRRSGTQEGQVAMEGYNGWSWNVSGATCRTIAKEPTFQAWSAGVYSGGMIDTSQRHKCVSAELRWGDYSCSQTSNDRYFGSWTEYEAIAIGKISGFASGAGYGFQSNPTSALTDGRSGGRSASGFKYGQVSNLTISNAAASKGTSNISTNKDFLTKLKTRYVDEKSISSSCDIPSFTQAPGTLKVYACDTANINGNINAASVGTYTAIDQLPHVIIIAKQINIARNVTRVDAWLIASNPRTPNASSADGIVNTCMSFQYATAQPNETQADSECSEQLTVNGTIVAKKVYLNRTGGALPGPGSSPSNQGSIDAAEIIDLRADDYLWAYSEAEDYHQATTTYMRELSPRY